MILLVIYAVALLLTAAFPSWLQLILLIVNVGFLPDPIPYADELIEAGIFIKTLKND